MKKVISLVLSLVLLAALAVPAFAADETNVEQYGTEGGFLAIGDSISRGMGSVGYLNYPDYEDFGCRNVRGSYPYIIAQAVGCNVDDHPNMTDAGGTFWPCCYPGMGLAAFLDLLNVDDNNYYDSEHVHNYNPRTNDIVPRYLDYILRYFGNEDSVDADQTQNGLGLCADIRDCVRDAKLITVMLGMHEFLNRPYSVTAEASYFDDPNLSTVEATAKFVERLLSELDEGFRYWVNNYPLLIRYLKENNKNDATIVLVGGFNVVTDVELFDGALLPIGTALTTLTATMNSYLRQWAKDYGLIYVDVTNAETAATQYDWSVLGEGIQNLAIATHPTPEGHEYIARQILSALPTKDGSASGVSTSIRVDLGNFTEADHVLLDGVPITNYSMNGTILTVPCCHKLAKSVTVMVKGKDGGLDMKTYQLVWHEKTGYTAYRMYGKNGVLPVTTKLAETVRSAWTKTLDITVGSLKNIFRGGIFRLVK